MAYEKKDGDIAVFANKSDNDKAPAWKGDALIGGVTYEVALWAKGDKGTMLAGNIKVKGAAKRQDPQAPLTPAPKPAADPLADEIPF